MAPLRIRRARALSVLFLVCWLAAALSAAASAGEGPSGTVVLVILDGCPANSLEALSPETYLGQAAAGGQYQRISTVFPSSTAAGHAAILTGRWPDENGVTGKEFMTDDGELSRFRSPELLEAPTIIERAARAGLATALISGKTGVASLFSEGADLVVSPASVPAWVLEEVGPPPDESRQYDDFCGWYEELDRWVIDVAGAFLEKASPGALLVLNLAGPDKVGHKFGPAPAAETVHCLISAGEALKSLAESLEKIAGDDWAVVVTADHGMTHVTQPVVPWELLESIDDCTCSLDGGVLCAWPAQTAQDAVVALLESADGVADVITPGSETRARLHHSHPRSAPVIAVVDEGYMFIQAAPLMSGTKGSHGALLETDMEVPLVVYGPRAGRMDHSAMRHTVEIAGAVAELLGGLPE